MQRREVINKYKSMQESDSFYEKNLICQKVQEYMENEIKMKRFIMMAISRVVPIDPTFKLYDVTMDAIVDKLKEVIDQLLLKNIYPVVEDEDKLHYETFVSSSIDPNNTAYKKFVQQGIIEPNSKEKEKEYMQTIYKRIIHKYKWMIKRYKA